MAALKYYSLHTAYADLGIFLNHFARIASGEWWRVFLSHVQPFLLLWGGLFAVLPPETVAPLTLVGQAVLLAWPVRGLYRTYGPLAALAFALYFPLWFNALFDFHVDHLAVPLLFSFFLLAKRGKTWSAVSVAMILMLVKEQYALQAAACGIYLLLIHKPRIAGVILILTGSAYFYFATEHLLPFYTMGVKGAIGTDSFSWLGSSSGEMLWNILKNPLVILGDIVTNRDKLVFVTSLLGSLGFISLLRPAPLLVAIPILGIILLSKHPNYYALGHHYTAGLIAPIIIAFAEGLPVARRLWNHLGMTEKWFLRLLVAGVIAGHILLAPSPIGRLFLVPKVWSYQASAYLPTERDRMIKDALEKYIQADHAIVLSIQNTLNWERIAFRKFVAVFPDGAIEPAWDLQGRDRTVSDFFSYVMSGKMSSPTIESKSADYVILDLKRPWYIRDRGCDWLYGKCQNASVAQKFEEYVARSRRVRDVIYENDGLIILGKENARRKEERNEVPFKQ
jgi:uncharacterized membrane protein